MGNDLRTLTLMLLSGYVDRVLVLLCHKWSLAARTSGQPSHQGARESNADGGDRVGDVAFGTERRRRGVGNSWVGEAL